jgi:phosphate transport system substrate-binding protein
MELQLTRILETNDPGGIAFCGFGHQAPQVKALAIAEREGGPFIELSKASVSNRTYPLTRTVYIYINQASGRPVDVNVREFLRYVVSREGQHDVTKQDIYLPLTAGAAREQLRKLLN